MSILEAATIFFQLLVPLGMIAQVGLVQRRTRVSLTLDVALAASYLVAIALVGLWLAVPWYLPRIMAGLLIVAAVVGARRTVRSRGNHPSLAHRLGRGAQVVLVVAFVAPSAIALAGWRAAEGTAVDLSFPLRQGTYLVAAGGSTEVVNPHLKTRTAERYRAHRGQSHAVDLVRSGAWGSRRSHPFPDHPSGFTIFGDSLYAPCSGMVVRAVDGAPDLGHGGAPSSLEGNHVILECGDAWIVLAHMMQGSVRVTENNEVLVGDILGLVGNSGSSDEPHLHIHAQTPGTPEAPIGGEPLPITFDGRYLARNQRIEGG